MMFLFKYKGCRGDDKMTDQKKATLKLKWVQIRHRESPLITPVTSDDEMNVQDNLHGSSNLEQNQMVDPHIEDDGTLNESPEQVMMAFGNQGNINCSL